MNILLSGAQISLPQPVRQPRFAKSLDMHPPDRSDSVSRDEFMDDEDVQPQLSPEDKKTAEQLSGRFSSALKLFSNAFAKSFKNVFVAPGKDNTTTPEQAAESLAKQGTSFAEAVRLRALPENVDQAIVNYNQATKRYYDVLQFSPEEKKEFALPVALDTPEQRRQAVQMILLSPVKIAQKFIALAHTAGQVMGSEKGSLALTKSLNLLSEGIENIVATVENADEPEKQALIEHYRSGRKQYREYAQSPLMPSQWGTEAAEKAMKPIVSDMLQQFPELHVPHEKQLEIENAIDGFEAHLSKFMRQRSESQPSGSN